jgi:hypothetical protein
MALDSLYGDRCFFGSITFAGPLNLGSGTIGDPAVAAGANVAASKLEHQYEPVYRQESGTTAATGRQVLHVVKGATGTIMDFRVGAVTAAIGGATATFDLKKNGSTILTGTIGLDSSTAAFALKTPAGYTSTALVAGDVLEVHVTAVAAGGGTLAVGLFAQLVLREKAQ